MNDIKEKNDAVNSLENSLIGLFYTMDRNKHPVDMMKDVMLILRSENIVKE